MPARLYQSPLQPRFEQRTTTHLLQVSVSACCSECKKTRVQVFAAMPYMCLQSDPLHYRLMRATPCCLADPAPSSQPSLGARAACGLIPCRHNSNYEGQLRSRSRQIQLHTRGVSAGPSTMHRVAQPGLPAAMHCIACTSKAVQLLDRLRHARHATNAHPHHTPCMSHAA